MASVTAFRPFPTQTTRRFCDSFRRLASGLRPFPFQRATVGRFFPTFSRPSSRPSLALFPAFGRTTLEAPRMTAGKDRTPRIGPFPPTAPSSSPAAERSDAPFPVEKPTNQPKETHPMKTKLEAALIMLNMAQHEPDEAKRDALLVGIHHTVRSKLHMDRNGFRRALRKSLAASADAMGVVEKGGTAVFVERGTAAKEA